MAKSNWGRMLRYILGAGACLLAGINVLIGSAWYISFIIGVAGVGLIYGSGRRTFRAGVSRTGDQIVCRYIPWYEGNAYVFGILLPLMGIAGIAAGSAPGHPPAWLWYGGIVLLCISALLIAVTVFIWRRSLLRFTPSELTLRLAERGSELTDIPREHVKSIEDKLVPNASAGTESLQVEVVYYPVGVSNGTTKTVMLGTYLSVQPINLANALVAWKEGAYSDPSELMDRIEGILRGRSTVPG
ncbi:MAG: hypothetical protein P4L86_28915 [Mycobacterium sp.]|nr:hypothetical protein [Mycobacterium sp.]